MIKRISFLLIFIVCLTALRSGAQEFPMLHYTINDDLPSDNVYQVFRDSKGFLWIATDKGVARYNGLKFEKFTTFNGLPDNEIFFFEEDQQGRIWLGTFNGELCYYQYNSFHTAQNTPFLKLPFKSPHTYCVVPEEDSSVTINFYDKRTFINIRNDQVNTYHTTCINDMVNGAIIHIRKQTASTYVATFRKNLSFLKTIDKSLDIVIDTQCNIVKQIPTILDSTARGMISQNKFLFIDDKYIYSPDKKIIRQLKKGFFTDHFIYAYYDDSVNFFLGTDHGLYINDSINILPNDRVSSVTSDNNGNYWISTLQNGLYCLRKNFFRTARYEHKYQKEVRYAYADAGAVFFATTNNNLYKLKGNECGIYFNYESYKGPGYRYPSQAGYLIDEMHKYYSLYNKDLIVINDVSAPRAYVSRYENYTWWINIKALISAREYLYMQGRDRIFRAKSDELKDRTLEYMTDSTSEERIFAMAKNANDDIWYSTIKAVYKIHDAHGIAQSQFGKESFKSFAFFGKYLVGYNHRNQLLVCSDIDGHIRIDTVEQQNCIWDKLYALDSGHILISTDNLYRILSLLPDKEGKFSVFAIENPFVPVHAEAICSDKTMCNFFLNGSITSIDIQSLLEKPLSPRLFFTTLKTDKQSYFISDRLDVPFNEAKNIVILFSTLSNQTQVFYQYSISKDGKDHWIDLVTERINISEPGHGDYTIKIRAKTVSSDYCVPVAFSMHILKPFWSTLWFIGMCICMAAVIIVWIARRRIIYLVLKNKGEHEKEVKFMQSEYKALNALMNPHFIFNTLNNVQSLFNENDKIAANNYLRIFADLIRQNMQNVSKELITLQKEITLVTNYLLLEKLRFEDKLNYKLNIEEGVDMSDVLVPPLLIQPLVENSIKHGIFSLNSKEGFIEINIYERNETLHIEVRDNGNGMHKKNKTIDPSHESFGLENIRKRIHHLSVIQNKEMTFSIDDLTNEGGSIVGTIALITIPY